MKFLILICLFITIYAKECNIYDATIFAMDNSEKDGDKITLNRWKCSKSGGYVCKIRERDTGENVDKSTFNYFITHRI